MTSKSPNERWSIDQILQEIGIRYRNIRRLDDGADLLSCRLGGSISHRSIYIYLHGPLKYGIKYDLEDESVGSPEWDDAVERGVVTDIEDLLRLCKAWLEGEGDLASCKRETLEIYMKHAVSPFRLGAKKLDEKGRMPESGSTPPEQH